MGKTLEKNKGLITDYYYYRSIRYFITFKFSFRPLSAAIMEHNMLQFCHSLGNIEIKKPKRFGKSTITQRLEKLKTEEEAKLYIYGLIPPILKSDIRRYYPMIFAHVYNSCDYGMVRSFIQTFMEDEINFLIKRPSKLNKK